MADRLPPQQEPQRRPKSVSVLRRAPEFHRDLKIARSLNLTTTEFYALPETEQSLQIEAHAIEQGTCALHGGPIEECADPTRDWFPQRTVCYAAMESAAANAMYDDLHEKAPYHDGTFKTWAAKRSASHPYHARDGVAIWVAPADLDPADKFLG